MSKPDILDIKQNLTISDNLKTNLNCSYYANQLNYKKIGNIVFCYLIINTQSYENNSEEDFYVEMPFTFNNNWFFPPIKATPTSKNYYIKVQPGTNKLFLTLTEQGTPIKVKNVGVGYIIDTQFFAFIEDK